VKNAIHSVTALPKPEQKNEEIQDLVRQRAYQPALYQPALVAQ
jgi:hypothetical protein